METTSPRGLQHSNTQIQYTHAYITKLPFKLKLYNGDGYDHIV